jgi:hypothetical protein
MPPASRAGAAVFFDGTPEALAEVVLDHVRVMDLHAVVLGEVEEIGVEASRDDR